MKQKVKLTEGQLKQIVENASRMVIQEMLDNDSFFRDNLNGRIPNNPEYKFSSALNFMPSKSAHKSGGLYKPSGFQNPMPNSYAYNGFNGMGYNYDPLYKPTGPFGFMPNPYAYNGFNGMVFNNPGMYFPNGFYPGYQG